MYNNNIIRGHQLASHLLNHDDPVEGKKPKRQVSTMHIFIYMYVCKCIAYIHNYIILYYM